MSPHATAAHVVESKAETYVRFRTGAVGAYKDEPVPEWLHLPGADVAVAALDRNATEHFSYIPLAVSPTPTVGLTSIQADWKPNLGERVYFVGLFSLWTEMGDRNVPMVRSGTLGATYQPKSQSGSA